MNSIRIRNRSWSALRYILFRTFYTSPNCTSLLEPMIGPLRPTDCSAGLNAVAAKRMLCLIWMTKAAV